MTRDQETLAAGGWPVVRERAREQHAVLARAAVTLAEGVLTERERRHAEGCAHSLAVSLRGFRMLVGAELAQDIRTLFASVPVRGEAEASRLSDLVAVLARELAVGPAADRRTEAAPPGWLRPAVVVLVVDADEEFAARLATAGAARGLLITTVVSAGQAWTAVAEIHPDVVVLDPGAGDALAGGRELLAGLSREPDPVAVVVVSAPVGGIDAAEALRLGGAGFLAKPAAPEAVLDLVTRSPRERLTESTVLVADTDASAAEAIAVRLRSRGLRVRTISDSRCFRLELHRTHPEVLILGLDSADSAGLADGLALCRSVRDDPGWDGTQIIVLTDGPAQQRWALLRAGADDVLGPRIHDEELQVRVTTRLARARRRTSPGVLDAETGLPGWPMFHWELRQLIAIGQRAGLPVAVAVLAVDDQLGLHRRYGGLARRAAWAALAVRLRENFRAQDIVGARDDRDHQLVLGLYGASAEVARQRVAGVLKDFHAGPVQVDGQAIEVTASAGLVGFPRDGVLAEDLITAAAGLLDRARLSGGGRIQTSADGGSNGKDTSIVIV